MLTTEKKPYDLQQYRNQQTIIEEYVWIKKQQIFLTFESLSFLFLVQKLSSIQSVLYWLKQI